MLDRLQKDPLFLIEEYLALYEGSGTYSIIVWSIIIITLNAKCIQASKQTYSTKT